MTRAVLVAGCPRSGTSITGEVVAAHRDCRLLFEPAAMRRHRPTGWWEEWLAGQNGVPVIKYPDLLRCAESALACSGVRLVWVRRGLRDTAASIWCSRQRRGSPWSMRQCVAFAREYGPLGRHLQQRFQTQVRLVHFAELLAEPGCAAAELFAWLGLSPDTAAVRWAEEHVSGSTAGYAAAGQQIHFTPHEHRLGRWQELPDGPRAELVAATGGPRDGED